MQPRQWDASVSYTPQIARAIIEEASDILVRDIRFLGEGWDNTVFLVNEELVFRFVRREAGLEFARFEFTALPLLPPTLPLPIPRITSQGVYLNKWPWMSYGLMEGDQIYNQPHSDNDRIDAAETIASFLQVLHGENPEKYQTAGVPEDWLGHMDLAKRVPFAKEKLNILMQRQLIESLPEYSTLIDAVAEIKLNYDRAIIHGDFKAAHILFQRGKPSGVIDWGDVHIGHRATDLAIAFTFFPLEGRRIFRQAYGNISEETWLLAKFRAMFHTFAIIEYAVDTKQIQLLEEARKAIQWTFAD